MPLQTQSSRIFPGCSKKFPIFQGIQGLEQKIPKFKEFQVFQVVQYMNPVTGDQFAFVQATSYYYKFWCV